MVKIRKLRKKYSYRRRGVHGRIRVPAHRVTYYTKRRNYAAFKFVSPWKQFQEEGEVEPEYAKFGTRKLRVGEERELARLEKELAELRRRKLEREKLFKELETPPKIKFEEPEQKIKQPAESKIITDLKKKVEKITPEQVVQRHKAEAAELRKQEKEELKGRFIAEKSLSPEVASIAVQKYEALLKQDPKGRNIGEDWIFNRAARLAIGESKGEQKVIPGVKTYSDSDYIAEIQKLGFPERDAQNLFFNLSHENVINKTPQQVAKMVEKIPQLEYREGMLIESKPESPTIEYTSKVLDRLLPRREDLQKLNRISVINKLRKDLTDVPDADDTKLKDFFNMDKPLKEVLKDEIESEAKN